MFQQFPWQSSAIPKITQNTQCDMPQKRAQIVLFRWVEDCCGDATRLTLLRLTNKNKVITNSMFRWNYHIVCIAFAFCMCFEHCSLHRLLDYLSRLFHGPGHFRITTTTTTTTMKRKRRSIIRSVILDEVQHVKHLRKEISKFYVFTYFDASTCL